MDLEDFDIMSLVPDMSLASRSRYLRATVKPIAVMTKMAANNSAAFEMISNASYMCDVATILAAASGHPR